MIFTSNIWVPKYNKVPWQNNVEYFEILFYSVQTSSPLVGRGWESRVVLLNGDCWLRQQKLWFVIRFQFGAHNKWYITRASFSYIMTSSPQLCWSKEGGQSDVLVLPCQYTILILIIYTIYINSVFTGDSTEMLKGVLKAWHDNCSVKMTRMTNLN